MPSGFNSTVSRPPSTVRGLARLRSERWVNATSVGDKATARRSSTGSARCVEEVVIDNGHRSARPEPYLNASPTGGAIAAALV